MLTAWEIEPDISKRQSLLSTPNISNRAAPLQQMNETGAIAPLVASNLPRRERTRVTVVSRGIEADDSFEDDEGKIESPPLAEENKHITEADMEGAQSHHNTIQPANGPLMINSRGSLAGGMSRSDSISMREDYYQSKESIFGRVLAPSNALAAGHEIPNRISSLGQHRFAHSFDRMGVMNSIQHEGQALSSTSMQKCKLGLNQRSQQYTR